VGFAISGWWRTECWLDIGRLLHGDANLRGLLVEALDTFVEVGWPWARRFTWDCMRCSGEP
jgi:hypothetical protein